jgi:hypothetical protein
MKIVGFGQMVDLETGTAQIAHRMTVETPDGRRVDIRTDELTVQQLLQATLNGAGELRQPAPPPQQTMQEMVAQASPETYEEYLDDSEEDEGEMFGGDYDPNAAVADAVGSIAAEPEPVMGTMAEEPVAAPPPSRGLGQGRKGPRPVLDADGFMMPVRARTVPQDEMGYPVVPGRQVVQTIPDDDGEEDGQQI